MCPSQTLTRAADELETAGDDSELVQRWSATKSEASKPLAGCVGECDGRARLLGGLSQAKEASACRKNCLWPLRECECAEIAH